MLGKEESTTKNKDSRDGRWRERREAFIKPVTSVRQPLGFLDARENFLWLELQQAAAFNVQQTTSCSQYLTTHTHEAFTWFYVYNTPATILELSQDFIELIINFVGHDSPRVVRTFRKGHPELHAHQSVLPSSSTVLHVRDHTYSTNIR